MRRFLKKWQRFIKNLIKLSFLPPKYAYLGGTNILDNQILFVEFENNFILIIKNRPLTQMMRISFEFMEFKFMWDYTSSK